MKTKRFLTILLAFVMVVQLLPIAATAAVVSSSEAYKTVKELEAGRAGAPENTIKSIDDFNVSGGVISFSLSLTDTLSNGNSSSGTTIDAVVMSAADYIGNIHQNSPTKVNNTNFNSSSLLQVSGTYWRSGTAVVTADHKATFTSMGTKLTFRAMAVDNVGNPAVTANDCYYDDYVLILFNAAVGAGEEGRYVVKKFQVDSEGNLKTDSYMVRYVKNTDSMGTKAGVSGTIAQQITKPSTEPTTLTPNQYTRTGYTFMGWDEDPKFLQNKGSGAVSASGKGTDWVNSVASMSDDDAKTGMDYPVGGTNKTVPAQPQDSIYNLYAQWKPIQVTLSPVTEKPGGPALETTPHSAAYDEYQAKVNVKFDWKFKIEGASGTKKGVEVSKVQEVAPGTTTPVPGGITDGKGLKDTYGLSVSTSEINNSGQVSLTGTPKRPTENDILVTIRTWDKTNFSYAEQVLRIKGIAKGAQVTPARDVNTGLQSNVLTQEATEETAESKDGVIFGLYSMAQDAEKGYSGISDGSGSVYDYYTKIQTTATVTRNESLLYEYIPYKDAANKEYFNADDPDTAKFDPKVAANWREVPLPKTFYSAAAQTTLAPSMAAGAAEKAHSSNKSNSAQSTVITVETPADWAGWSQEYGYITFDHVDALGIITADGNFPVIHGLVEGATYLIRMKANNDYSESTAVELVIKEGGGGGGDTSSGSGGLAVNLAGGTWDTEAATGTHSKEEYDRLVAYAAQLTPGAGTILDLKDFPFEPVREGCEFLGWTLGEWANGGPILYRHKSEEPNPPETEEITVKWLDDDGVTELATANFPKDTLPPYAYPEDKPLPIRDGFTVSWSEPVTDSEGNITITAVYTPEVPPTETPAARADDAEGGDAGDGETGPVEEIQYIWIDGFDNSQIGEPVTSTTAPEESTYPEPPTHDGYKFTGWTVGEAEEIENVKTVKITANYEAEIPVETELPEQVPFQSAPASLAAVWSGGSSSTDGILAVTAYDWDGEMLGTFIFRSDPDPKTQEQNAQQAISEFVAREDVAAKLSNKPGYDFLTWVKDESGIPTSYGVRVSSAANAVLEELSLAEEDALDFSTLTESTTTKAAYTSNDTLTTGEGLGTGAEQIAARHYQTKIVEYGRFGATQNFSITVQVERGNVPRATSPWLLVRSEISGVSVYSRYALTGADTETVQVALYAATNSNGNLSGVALVEWTVIDDYQYSNWVNAGKRTNTADCQSKATFKVRDVGTSKNQQVWDQGTYPLEGIVTSIYEQLLARDTDNTAMSVIAAHLRTVGIVPSVTNNNTLRNNIYENWVTLGKPKLTWEILNTIASQAPPITP